MTDHNFWLGFLGGVLVVTVFCVGLVVYYGRKG